MAQPRYDAVLFDLLSALLDSWTLWDNIAGSEPAGRKWRNAYLRETYATGAYRAYETLVEEAAVESGLPASCASRLAARYGELRPWPEVGEVLGKLHSHLPLGVVTNCSNKLGAMAVAVTGIQFRVVITAEDAGFYKPDPRPYQQALEKLAVSAERCLFVAGSAYDLFGTGKVGLPTYWHNRVGMALPPGAPQPLAQHQSLLPLLELVI